jgi:O-6-methylguanine DNA methyltransferase
LGKKLKFSQKVFEIVRRIPKGKVSTYSQVAKLCGSPRAFRAVGSALRRNPIPIVIPCHRVVKNNGIIGDYKLGQRKKKELLESEKIEFREEFRVNLKKHLWKVN